MRILLLTHTFNSLCQRLHIELSARGHELAVELDINDTVTTDAVHRFRPQLLLAPFLKRRIPASIFAAHTCLIVHPGPPGNRGPTALDWAILEDRQRWGVTVLEAKAQLDAGPIWAWRTFSMRPASKSSVYRFELTEAAVVAVLDAVERYASGGKPLSGSALTNIGTGWRDAVSSAERRIDWRHDNTATILRKIHSADGRPGVADEILGLPCRLFDAHPEATLCGQPGALIARRGGAVCRATIDGAVWIGHLQAERPDSFKLPAVTLLGKRLDDTPESAPAAWTKATRPTWQPVYYRERDAIGYLHFDFYNGAMGTDQCRELLAAFSYARSRPTRVIVLAGGCDFWCNGLDLNQIEAAASPADESWRNIQAMDDVCAAIISTTSHLIIAALASNAGAGGVFLALGADRVVARDGIVLNPHYRNMGNLYGSEYWTYLLPKRVSSDDASEVMARRLPLGTNEAWRLGLIDAVAPIDPVAFWASIDRHAAELAAGYHDLLAAKSRQRSTDELQMPLSAYRKQELEHMHMNFYGFDPSYHVARYRFVHRSPQAWTPLYLAPHRRLGWRVPPTLAVAQG